MGCLRAPQQTRTLTTSATVTTSGAAGAAGVGQRSRSGTSNVSHTARHTVFGFSPSASAWFTVRSPRAASTWSLATLSAYASPNCARIRSQNSVRRTAARLPAGAWDSASPRPVFRISTCHGLPSSGWFLGPGQRDVQVGQDRPLDLGEPVKDDAGWGVGEVQAVEGGQ